MSRVRSYENNRDRYLVAAEKARYGWSKRWYESCARTCESQRLEALVQVYAGRRRR